MTERVFAQPFDGVRAKEVYPTAFAAGDVCPPELVDAAEACGVLAPTEAGEEPKGDGKPRGKKPAAEQAQADASVDAAADQAKA